MAELSERFAELMARLAKSDAELFRTLGEQNASVRLMVDELTAPAAATGSDQPPTPALHPQALLPLADCELARLKARFRRIPEAQAWLEERLGPAPKKPSWAVLEATFRQGAWPTPPPRRTSRSSAAGASAAALEQTLLQRLDLIEQRLQQRLDGLEQLLRALGHCGARPAEPAGHPAAEVPGHPDGAGEGPAGGAERC